MAKRQSAIDRAISAKKKAIASIKAKKKAAANAKKKKAELKRLTNQLARMRSPKRK